MAIFDFWIPTAMLFLLYYIVYISSSELGADVELPANLTRTSLKARAFTPSLDLSCHNVQVDLFSTRQAITLFPSVHLSVRPSSAFRSSKYLFKVLENL